MTKTAESSFAWIRTAVAAAGFALLTCPAKAAPPTIGPVNVGNTATATHVDEAFDVDAIAGVSGSSVAVVSCEYTVDGSSWGYAFLTVLSSGNVRCSASPMCADGAPLAINIRATNNLGETGTGTAVNRTCDAVGPSGGSVTYPSGSVGSSISVSFSAGTDSGSGIGTTTLEKALATRSGGSCGAFGAWTVVATNPTSPLSVSLAKKRCVKFRLRASDVLGHPATYDPGNVAWRN